MRTLAVPCVLATLVWSAACEPKGHASVVRCVGGRIVTMEIPLSKVDEEPEFKSCGDDGRCVSGKQDCPPPAVPQTPSQ